MKDSSPEQSVRSYEIIDKEKKKRTRRRSNRRSRQSSGFSKIHSLGCAIEDDNRTRDCVALNDEIEEEEAMVSMRASDAAFNSMPPIMRFEDGSPCGDGEICKQLLSKSCPDPRACEITHRMDGEFLVQELQQRKIFTSHWSLSSVKESLEKGEAFKAMFRVNAHNRSEAYCKIDGVPTDILINGNVGQNRAVEGDIVVIKLDPLSLWPKMKGFVIENVSKHEERNGPENGFSTNKVSVMGQGVNNCVRSCPEPLLDPCLGSSNLDFSAVEKLCTVLSSFPNKRPTGQVVAIFEKSLVRDSIVGLLDVKGWIRYKEGDAISCNKSNLSLSDDEYVQLMPTDSRLPKLIVPFHVLPEKIKARLETIDPTLLVAAQIVEWDEGSPIPLAHITRIFGRGSELKPQISSILYQNLVCDSDFSPCSLTCLPHIPWEVPEEEVRCRKDLRDLCVITIDPSTATDLDDALSVQSLPDGFFRVGVHIADVSYFVLPETDLDTEAKFRSTSVYMVHRKIPMLPPLLSENLGSLNPGADRLAFSIFWDLNGQGDVIDRWIGRTVIRSCCKLSYDHAQEIIDGTIEMSRPSLYGSFQWSDVVRSVKQLHEISTVLRQRRFRQGALRLDNNKPVFLFDGLGVPYDFAVCTRKPSNFLVEEFMLLANITAAEVISRAYPDAALLRKHPEPNTRKLKEFELFCSKHGMDLNASSSGKFHESLEKIITETLKDDSVFVDILNSYAIKPMQLASYFCTGDDMDEWGHYALAVPVYTHFTSPLRRYPDIVVHRALAAAVEAGYAGVRFDRDAAESVKGKEMLLAAALKHGVPSTETLSVVAAYCNERKLAARKVRDGCDKLYTWFVLKKKEVFPCEARVMNLGPRFMTIYISKLGIERRIYYDQIEGLSVDYLEATSTLIIKNKLYSKSNGRGKGGGYYYKPLKESVYLVSPCDMSVHDTNSSVKEEEEEEVVIVPTVFPLTVGLFSTVPVVLNALGGDDGPLDIGARLYMTSYYR
ncbi:unnamed protein product [Cochlearia groenlandica]